MRILRIILGCSFLIFVSVLIVDAQMADPLIPPVPGRPLGLVRSPMGFDEQLELSYMGVGNPKQGVVPGTYHRPDGVAGNLRRPPRRKAVVTGPVDSAAN